MARFRLVVTPDGHAMLTYDGDLTRAETEQVIERWRQWRETEGAVMIIERCDVVQVVDVDLDVPFRDPT